jgi:hypothetical protein
LTNTNNAAVDNTYINYTITGATAQQLGLASLTGHFPYLSPAATNPQSASIVLPIPLSSAATTFTLTTDSDQPSGSANITITVTNNNIVNNEVSHVHLVAGDPSVVDLYLGDDDQYVKIERDHGNVVIGATNFYGSPSNITSTWTFGIDGTMTFPDATVQTTANITGQTTVLLNGLTEGGHAGYTITSITATNVIYFIADNGYSNSTVHQGTIPIPSYPGQKLTLINDYIGSVNVVWPFGESSASVSLSAYENSELTAFNHPTVGLQWWETNRYGW